MNILKRSDGVTFEKNDEGCIRFTDTKNIPYSLWEKLLRRINYLGYDIPDTDFLKKYFDSNVFLQKDQSKTVLALLNNEHNEPLYSEKQIIEDTAKIKNIFGTTYNEKIAGYLLIDGTMLRMSYDGYMRNIDHREVSQVIDAESTTDAMIQFINYGNIRMITDGFELSKVPNKAQINTMSRIIHKYDCVKIDISNQTGQVIKTFDYTIPILAYIINDITEYFKSLE